MSSLYEGKFWAETGERAAKTFCQAAVALMIGDGTGLLDVNWGNVFSVAGLAAVISVLTSVGSSPFATSGTPSLIPAARKTRKTTVR